MAVGPGPSNANFPSVQASFSGRIPAGGSKVVPYQIDLSATNPTTIDMTLQQQQGYIDIIQTVYIDASGCAATVQLYVPDTRQYIDVASRSQGYYPILVPKAKLVFEVSAPVFAPAAGEGLVTLIFMNMPLPTGQWFNNLLGTVNDKTGAVRIIPTAASVEPTDHSTTTGAASATLFPANAERYLAMIQAPLTADIWVHPFGGTASVSGSGCFRVPAGSLYESPAGMSFFGDWNYYCATPGLVLTAWSVGDV